MTRHPDAYTGTSPADRVRAYLDARAGFQGLDQEDIHSVGIKDVVYELTASDLRALVAAAEASPYRADRITDQNVQDIVDTAAYGGITYWAIEPDSFDYEGAPEDAVATIHDGEEDKVHYLTADQIRDATVALAINQKPVVEGDDKRPWYVNDTIQGYVVEAFRGWTEADGIDCGEIDASAADCIVQVACFGEVVYG